MNQDIIPKTEYHMKLRFLSLIDGYYDGEPMVDGISSYTIGLCKMEYINDIFHIHLRRPGLLIGKKGETITKITKLMGVPLKVHEFDLLNS